MRKPCVSKVEASNHMYTFYIYIYTFCNICTDPVLFVKGLETYCNLILLCRG